jgi:predicted Zn-dependent peptidase
MYSKTTLENGLRVVTESIPGMRSVAMGILIDASPWNEAFEQNGLAHFCEHAMFQGTSSRDAIQIAREMDIGGGSMGAFTSRDYTCYYATVLDDYQTYALDLLGDLLLNSTFPQENLQREQEAILREIAASSDAPSEQVNTILKGYAWPDSPLGWPTAGQPASVSRLTREDVIYFVHENYLPDRMIVAASGNLNHADFVAQVRDAFWRMMGERDPLKNNNPRYQPGAAVAYVPVSQAYFSVGIPAYPYAHPRRYELHALNNILGGGISSRLFRRMREDQGLVYHIGSEYHAYRDAGMWVIEGSTAPENLRQVLAMTLIEMWQMVSAEEPVTEEELWKTKMQIKGQHLIAGENTHTRMSRLATQEFYFGRYISSDEIMEAINAVDLSSLSSLCTEDLLSALRRPCVAVVGPEAPEHYSVAVIEELLADFQ